MRAPLTFFLRWSERKIKSRRPAIPAGDQVSNEPNTDVTPESSVPLPSIDEITSETEVSGFLAPGVPPQLAREALRRAWSSDLTIRDYVGPADYAWDFHSSDAMLGFDNRDIGQELRDALMARLFQPEQPVEPPNAPDVRPNKGCVPPDEKPVLDDAERLSETAREVSASSSPESQPQHGGALPL